MTKITPPDPNRTADVGRAAARAAAGAIPLFGSVAAELIDGLLPDPSANRRDQWEQEVSDSINEAQDRISDIDRRSGSNFFEIKGGAAVVAKHMTELCPDGLANTWITLDDLATAYPKVSPEDLLDGLGDLEIHGLVRSQSFAGGSDIFRLNDTAYEALDPPIMGWKPIEDAKELSKVILTMGDSIGVQDLYQQIGWPRRRFNPALRFVLRFVAPGHISQECQMDYVTGWFLLTNPERAAIRKFSKD